MFSNLYQPLNVSDKPIKNVLLCGELHESLKYQTQKTLRGSLKEDMAATNREMFKYKIILGNGILNREIL